jgi:hypothetical protein
MHFEIKVSKNPIAELIATVVMPGRKELFKNIGDSVAVLARANAQAKERGGGFWEEIRVSVKKEVTDDGVIVGATHVAARHKHVGGVIRAPGQGPMSRKAEFLTIPIDPESKRKNVSDFEGKLFKQRIKSGKFMLFKKLGKGHAGEMKPLFLLLKETKFQKACPWFPEPGQSATDDAIRKGSAEYFKKQLKLT